MYLFNEGDFSIDSPENLLRAQRWQQQLIDSLKDMGQWAVPFCMSIYQFDKKNKVATLVVGSGDPTINQVLATMGWVVDKNPRQNAESEKEK